MRAMRMARTTKPTTEKVPATAPVFWKNDFPVLATEVSLGAIPPVLETVAVV
jgi:hypothetical protein